MRVEQRLRRVAGKLWPELATLDESEATRRMRELAGMLYAIPLAGAGLIWLVAATDPILARAEWPLLLLMALLAVLLNRLDFFWIVERRPGAPGRQQAHPARLAQLHVRHRILRRPRTGRRSTQ
jgi:hypothetical protein